MQWGLRPHVQVWDFIKRPCLDDIHGDKHTRRSLQVEVTWEIRQGPLLDDVLPVQGLQNLGAAEPLEAALHIVIIPFERLRPQNPAGRGERRRKAGGRMVGKKKRMRFLSKGVWVGGGAEQMAKNEQI